MEQSKTPSQELSDKLAACAQGALDITNCQKAGTFIGITIGVTKRTSDNDIAIDDVAASWHARNSYLEPDARAKAISNMVTIVVHSPHGLHKIMPILNALAENNQDINHDQLNDARQKHNAVRQQLKENEEKRHHFKPAKADAPKT